MGVGQGELRMGHRAVMAVSKTSRARRTRARSGPGKLLTEHGLHLTGTQWASIRHLRRETGGFGWSTLAALESKYLRGQN